MTKRERKREKKERKRDDSGEREVRCRNGRTETPSPFVFGALESSLMELFIRCMKNVKPQERSYLVEVVDQRGHQAEAVGEEDH